MQTLQSSRPLTDRDPGDIIVHGPDGQISVAEFIGRATALAGQLPDHDYVINLAADRYEFFLGFCAAIIAGQCTLMPPNRQLQTVQQVAADYPDCYLLDRNPIDGIEWLDVDFENIARDADVAEAPEVALQQLCAIVFTSGSTGAATPNRKYWKTLRSGALSNAAALLEGRSIRLNLIATVPQQHNWGFETSIMMPLFANIAVSHITPFFPQDIVDALESLPEPRALVSSPIHVDALLSAGVARPRVHRIYSATAPMSSGLARKLEKHFGGRVIEIFGCSEAGTFATRQTATETLWQISPTFQLEAAEEGVIIRAEHLPEDVVLHDVLEILADGQFRWHGRDQDMVNIAGKRGSLADLNHRLTSISGVVDGVIFMPEEDSKRLAALVVAPGLQPSDILEQLRTTIEPAFLPRPMYIVSMLPRQETGKLAKRMLIELFEQTRRMKAQQDDRTTDSSG